MANVLIVEDEKNTRNSLEDYIRHFGLAFQRIWTAENGRQAFEIFEKEHPEIVLSEEELLQQANVWSMRNGGHSGRVAEQFIIHLQSLAK